MTVEAPKKPPRVIRVQLDFTIEFEGPISAREDGLPAALMIDPLALVQRGLSILPLPLQEEGYIRPGTRADIRVVLPRHDRFLKNVVAKARQETTAPAAPKRARRASPAKSRPSARRKR